MKKQKDNLFRQKFHLLNSQDYAEDIKWSSSSSGELENVSCNEKNNFEKRRYRKGKHKKNVLNNVSNLDVTIVDSCKYVDRTIEVEKSPILKSKNIGNVSVVSPVLSTHFPPNRRVDVMSPVLSSKRSCPKSPVLNLKATSSNFTGRVKKKLCYDKNNGQKEIDTKDLNLTYKINDGKTTEVKDLMTINKNSEVFIKSESNSTSTLNDSDSLWKAKLVEKVKSYFAGQFSSENTSQDISDTPTPTPNDSLQIEEINILSCKSVTVKNLQTIKLENVCNSATSSLLEKTVKKVKYKRGGLAFRLNELLKKQNAHISLWQHERFLAENSNFVIPKEEYMIFRIKNCVLKYGCYMLNAFDIDNKKYLIVINQKYVNSNICDESVLKLYEPYKILSVDPNMKIFVNVCKFECIVIKS